MKPSPTSIGLGFQRPNILRLHIISGLAWAALAGLAIGCLGCEAPEPFRGKADAGAPRTGGRSGAGGGTFGTGGRTSSGGSGGAPASGGAQASGGVTGTGGAQTGGVGSGGLGSGGSASGGSSGVGGSGTGGAATGGANTGGSATGGRAAAGGGAGGGGGASGTGGRGGSTTGGSGVGGTTPGTGPCAGLCTGAIAVPVKTNSGELGPGATCHAVTGTVNGFVCGNFVLPRALSINGAPVTCGSNIPVPTARNGGYCVQTTAGHHSYAYFLTY